MEWREYLSYYLLRGNYMVMFNCQFLLEHSRLHAFEFEASLDRAYLCYMVMLNCQFSSLCLTGISDVSGRGQASHGNNPTRLPHRTQKAKIKEKQKQQGFMFMANKISLTLSDTRKNK
jgi:hypothetical protein